MIRAGTLRHVATVLRPPESNYGTLGQKQGQDEVIYKDWPCSIETLSGRESEYARQNYATATLVVKGYTDPAKPIKATDYLQFGARKINIGFVNDVDQNGLQSELLCGES